MKCDLCTNPATVHLIEIKDGEKIERHLCEMHAQEEGLTARDAASPINELLEKFIHKQVAQARPKAAQLVVACPRCGLTLDDFSKGGLLGCPGCYETFESSLIPLLERAHEGARGHAGKTPRRGSVDELRLQRLQELRKLLEEAVKREQYERAAKLRDEVRDMEADKP